MKEIERSEVKMYQNLDEVSIAKATELIEEEIEKSKQFDLFLAPELIQKETEFFLGKLNNLMGNKELSKSPSGFDQVIKTVTENMYETFDTEARSFFEKFKEKEGGASLRYNCHLESVRTGIARLAYELK